MSLNIELKGIFNLINEIPYIGVLIYQEKIVYTNKAVEVLTGYTKEELLNLTVLDLIPEKFHKNASKLIKRHLSGETFNYNYNEIPVIKKDGSLLNCLVYSSSILYNSKPTGFLIALNITEQKILERTKNLISDTTKLIFSIDSEENFLLELCNVLTDIYGRDYICFGEINYKSQILEPYCGVGNKFPLELIGSTKEILANLNENKFFISDKLKILKDCSDFLSVNLFSICAIPIKKDSQLKYLLVIFSPFQGSFNENELKVLKSLKETIEFGLEKLQKDKNIKILYKALENSPDWVLITDTRGTIIYANKTVERLTGYSKDELIGNNPRVLKSGEYGREFYDKMWSTLLSGKPFSCVIINKDKFGNLFKLEHLLVPVKIGGKVTHFVALAKDLTREDKLEGEVYKLKFHDTLTGILNRYGFIFEVNNKFKIISDNEVGLLIVLDIYNFSYINKIYSESIGNEVLVEVAKLLDNIYFQHIISRVGADEFYLFAIVERKDIIQFLKNLIELFKFSKFSSKEINIGINLGVSIFPDDSKNINSLIHNAHSSLHIAKTEGENRFAIFNKKIEEKIKKDDDTKKLIVSAIENNWFEIYLQPYFYTSDLTLAGFEALLRINHPEKGILTPYFFIDMLEESDFIFEVEKKIVKNISEVILEWIEKDFPVKPISINLTSKSFKKVDVIDYIIDIVKNFKKNFINIEITERLYLEEPEYSKKAIDRLRYNGVKISLDDFGTGYSSLSYLTEIPIDYIKIDISFIRKFLDDKKTYSIVETIITLASKLNMKTIAEGIETKEQLIELRNLGCNIVQGYLFAKPEPIKDAERFLFEKIK